MTCLKNIRKIIKKKTLDNNRRLQENELYNRALAWLKGYGTFNATSSELNGSICYKIKLVRGAETIVREGEDLITLTIAFYNELHE